MTSPGPVIMWFRRDLRLAGNLAVAQAAAAGDGRALAVFVLDPRLLRAAGERRRNYLAWSLDALNKQLGGRLVLRSGDPAVVLTQLAEEVSATQVLFTADFGPYGGRRDAEVTDALHAGGVRATAVGSPYAVDPGSVVKQDGTPFGVFSPFFRAWQQQARTAPASTPEVSWAEAPTEPPLQRRAPETAGEVAATATWQRYCAVITDYKQRRNRPDLDATSRLSAALKYGEIHPLTILRDLAGQTTPGAKAYVRELAWREFCADLLLRYPDAATEPIRTAFTAMAYDEPGAAFDAWCAGRTGYPLVDAGMRQLLHEGYMHNRARMTTASFLVKDLHVHWKHGARWFMNQLRDGDLASNSLNWQWVAGCGVDPAPYYRIFNPILQGKKFDPDGSYVRRWVPELREVPAPQIHEPWQHPAAGGYPAPIVDHATARAEALRRYEAVRELGQ
ncbi:cryptochrome/photolyase family protein [Kribbella sp. CA-293567]|uniref:cryptochrome/photolyase family protein n=1 Tax=Kribbella sp. CA-293567 TaxID=3002436 RepID=UPI0022DDB238|nr:deoxyribodipyrimidine photo-lyase [Kribbella sp. CA-293567]WBQ07932.1 deoxyribodipyrimidine photo-lyase [Kribbella sp. CA-293567]